MCWVEDFGSYGGVVDLKFWMDIRADDFSHRNIPYLNCKPHIDPEARAAVVLPTVGIVNRRTHLDA